MKHLLLAFFLVFSANLFTACSSNTDNNVPQIGEHSAEFKIFMEKKKTGFPSVKDPRFGLIPSPLDNSNLLKQVISFSNKMSVKNAADPAYDLRDYGRVTSVKDQGGCGACWSFSAMASLESVFMPGEANDFSENNLKNLHGFDWGPCYGGNSDMAAAYFMRWNGPVNEADDPYFAGANVSPVLPPVKHVTDYYSVSSASILSIKEAVVELGAVDADMYWDDADFNTSTNAYYYSGSSDINHGISIIGWDDSYSRSNFNTEPANDGAWIIKNSWGDTWGDSGYFYISYEDSKINGNCHAFKATDIEYENLYSYDYFGRTGYGGYGVETAWIANVFTAGGDETLKAVSFYANAHSTAYEIRIYTGVTSNPTTGATLQTTQTGTAARSGYNSVVLDTPVDLSSGTKFSVVVKVTTPGNTSPVPLEMPVGGYASATASSGESFMTYDSGGNPASWLDVAGWSTNTNVNIKAYTVAQTGSEDPDTDDTDAETPDDTAEVIDLVINEIDYDQPSTDTAEFIELYNKGDAIASLSGISIQLINGTGGGAALYNTINLPDVSLAAGGYYVICANSATVANCDLEVTPETNLVQNGAPDAMALYNGAELLDTVSYEGEVPGYTETLGTVEDPPGTYSVGISRYPDGVDTGDNSSDFSVRCITPGAANSSGTSGCLCGNGNLDAGEDCELDDGSCCSANCEFEASDVVCRVADGACDVAETCSGTSAVCPADDLEPDTTQCRAASGDCDEAEYCDGTTKDCPVDSFAVAGTECRESAGVCDQAETCSGSGPNCPADMKLTAECRTSAGVCDAAEFCDGISNDCPIDVKKTSVCRGQSAFCDEAEFCDGVNNDCPEDKVKPDTLKCRSAAGICDAAEFCDGTTKTCPADTKLTTECRASTGVCDVAEVCDGVGNDCPADGVADTDVECRGPAGTCDVVEFCNGTNKTCPADVKKTTECRVSAGVCDAAEFCDGISNDCPIDVKKTSVCRGQSAFCDEAEFCDGVNNDCPEDKVKPDTLKCRSAAGICDAAEFCDGTNKTCPDDLKLTTECRAKDGNCDVAELCDGVSNDCPEDGVAGVVVECRGSGGICDAVEYCNGTNKTCPADLKKTTECRTVSGICDVAEFCDGINNDCPADEVKPVTDECRASGGVCDAAENCDGSGKDCPTDAKLTTECRASAGVCDAAEICDGVNNDCPSDAKLTSECRAPTGVCDVAEICDGIENDCPADRVAETAVECRGSNGICDTVEFCNGTNKTCPADEFAGSEVECRESAGECDIAETCSGSSADCPTDEFTTDGQTCIGDAYPWTEYKCYSGVCEAGDEFYGSCVAPNEISVFPYSDTQDTTGRPDHVVTYGTGCDSIKASGPDVAYELHVKVGFTYTITLNSVENMAFALLNACGDNEACVEAVDENTGGEESVEFAPETDAVYALVVETVGSTGEYTLTVTETAVENQDEDTDQVDDVSDEAADAELDDEMEDSDDAEVVDVVDNDVEAADEMEDGDDAEVVDETENADEMNDKSEILDNEPDEDNSDTTPLNDEDEAYNKTNDGCSCSLII